MLMIFTKTYLGHSFKLISNLLDLTHVISGKKKAFRFYFIKKLTTVRIGLILLLVDVLN